jgi:hypothetical protein
MDKDKDAQEWYCETCDTHESTSKHVTMIYHRHELALVVLSAIPLTMKDKTYTDRKVESKTIGAKVTKEVKKTNKIRTKLICRCKPVGNDNVYEVNERCTIHGRK